MANVNVDQNLRTLRIIIGAMLMGIVGFGVVAAVLVAGGSSSTAPGSAKVLLLVLAAVVVTEIPAYVAVRTVIMGNLRRNLSGQAPQESHLQVMIKGFQTLTLIGAALIEGPSFFAIIILLISGQWVATAAAVAGLLLLAVQIPTRDKFNRFAGNVTGQHWG